MSKLIKLTAVVSALAMLFVCLAVPAMAAETVVFSDNFEWGNDYSTTSNLVHKSGTSIGGATSYRGDNAAYGYYTDGLGSVTTEIINDSDSAHGQVLHYTVTGSVAEKTMRYDRGVWLDIPATKHVDGYTSIEYDYKPKTGGNASGTIATLNPSDETTSAWTWNTFASYLGETGPVVQGGYYRVSTANKLYNPDKQLTWSNYLPADLLEADGTLKKETWHNIRYVYDPNTVTYDLYVDGYLVVAGCSRFSSDLTGSANTADSKANALVVARILVGGQKDGCFEAYYDNFKVKALEAADVYAARKAAFEKKINYAEDSNEGVIYADERTEVVSGYEGIFLPYQGGFGINTIEHEAYRLVDSKDAEVVNEANKAPITYVENLNDASIAAGSRKYKWSGVNLAYRKLNVTKADAPEVTELLPVLNTYTATANLGDESYIGFSHFKGDVVEPKLTLTVDFSNGNSELEKTYTISFRRDLQNDLQDTIELRDAGWKGLKDGAIIENGALNHYTYIGNNSDKAVTVFGAMIFYDANGNVLATAAGETTALANTDVSTFTKQTEGFRLRFGDSSNYYYRDEKTGEWKRYIAETAPAGVEKVAALESIYANVKYDTKKIRIFLWDKATLQPLMTDMEVAVDTPRS